MFKRKKSLEVYSAAKATIMEVGKSREEVWEYFSLAFKDTPDPYLNLSYNNHPFTLIKGDENTIGVGHVYKNYGNRGSAIYYEIASWDPPNYFSYYERHYPTGAKAISQQKQGGNTMEFFFRDHYEGTVVEIHRRQQGTVTKRELIDLADGAQILLSNMLKAYYKKLDHQPHSIFVERDDSLKTNNSISLKRPEQPSRDYDYEVAFSFAGENRVFVQEVADYLVSKGIKVFYDKYEQVDLWGKDLYQHLNTVYKKKANYCVIFISKHYAEKLWTKHELESAQARAFTENREYILPARFDNTEIPGLNETVGYLDINDMTPENFGSLLLRKLR